jgi:hypothetical protein
MWDQVLAFVDYVRVMVETIVFAFNGTVPNGCWIDPTLEPMSGDMSTMEYGSRIVDCATLPAWYTD